MARGDDTREEVEERGGVMPEGPGSRLGPVVGLAALVLTTACGGGVGGGDGDSDGSAAPAGGPAADLPVSRPTGAVDQQLARKGQELFRTRGCISCHTIGGGRRVGPDLQGITERRDFAWTYHMITNPDSMVKNDSIAKRLLAEYMTPMADQNITPDQFRALYEYLRSESGDGSAARPGSEDATRAEPGR